MKSDRRFVEHIKNATQLRSDLSGEPDALAFAAGQRRRGTIKSQITKPDSVQETKAVLYLAQYRTSNLFFARVKLDLLERRDRILNRQRRVLRDPRPTDPHGQRIGTQALRPCIRYKPWATPAPRARL